MYNNSSNLSIIQINVNSLISRKKRHDMEIFLNKAKPHIVLLNETRIKPIHNVNFNNYNFIRNDRLQNNGGGTGILIKCGISYTVISRPPNINSIETTIIKLASLSNEILIVAAYYTPSRNTPILDTNDLTEILKLKSQPNSAIIIGGDLNAKHSLWGNTKSNPSGKQLFDWFNTNCITQNLKLLHSDLPSYNAKDSNSYLDIFLVSDRINIDYDHHTYPNLKTIEFESDHCAIELKISLNFRIPRQPPKRIPNYSAINWPELNHELNLKLDTLNIPTDRVLTKHEIDKIIQALQEILDNILLQHVPLTTLNYSTQIPLPPNITNIIKFKNTLRRQLHRNRHSPASQSIKSQVNNANTIIKQLIHIHYQNHWKSKLSNIKLNNNTFKEINRITKRKPYNNIPTLIDPSTNNQIEQPAEKANLLGQTFQDINTKNTAIGDPWFTKIINEQIHNYIEIQNSPLIKLSNTNLITSNEHCLNGNHSETLANPSQIKHYINTRNNKKSAGFDKIPNYVLKKLSPSFTKTLTIIINSSYNISYFPAPWKLAIIAPINKKGKPPDHPSSYRHISLLSNISKIYEKFILEKIQSHCEEHSLIPNNQFGFRAFHSTTHAAVVLKTDITQKLNQKIPTVACLLDIEKAFDTTWIEGLTFKLIKLKFDPHLIKTIYSFLTGRYLKVRVDNTLSKSFSILAGVPQGSLLGPILYTLYTSDIPLPLTCPIPIKSLSYADDTIIYTSRRNIKTAEKELNNYLKQLSRYFNKWKIKVNTTKCESIIFKGSKILSKGQKRNSKNLQIKHNNIRINQKKYIKYLGITLTEDLKPYQHIKTTIKKGIAAYNSIKGILNYNSKLQNKIKLICYKQLIRPILTYGFPVWSDLSSSQMEKLRLFERRMLRACSNIHRKANSYEYVNNKKLYKETKAVRIDKYMINQCIKFFERSQQINNPLITSSTNITTIAEEEYKYPPPCTIKYLHYTNQLYNHNNELTHYHKRSRPTTRGDLVYNIDQ